MLLAGLFVNNYHVFQICLVTMNHLVIDLLPPDPIAFTKSVKPLPPPPSYYFFVISNNTKQNDTMYIFVS